MWNIGSCFKALLCFMLINVLGCNGEIKDVAIEVVPSHGCAPLDVTLIGNAATRSGVKGVFRWTIGNALPLHGPRVVHTFLTPGTYAISLTVQGEKHAKTQTTMLEVGKAKLPLLAGLYVQQGCVYRAIEEVEAKTIVKDLGKTSLQDLEQRIVGRKLSTRELITHPLWRRDHTQIAYVVSRDRFVKIRLEQFQALGFVSVGEETNEIGLYRIISSPEPEQTSQKQVVTRLVDSWGLDNLDPEPVALTRTRLAANALGYIPDGQLREGLYFIEVKREDEALQGISPVTLVKQVE